ncbi:DMT family transporter [Psittacicella hinzii]|uniref:EamA domain-containing protein n=1 Tax=Psittacicella hinzii TaxID=2028575 RepID=A0A3A1YLM6_9GAMM|nr:DMT family transporter [Psittacicella hinzii]RIY37144.1 hypothetical protein CKF58_05160 [Psittacicella hinzii]
MSNLTKGILLALLSVFAASCMALGFKLIDTHLSVWEKMFARGIGSMIVTWTIICYLRQRHDRKLQALDTRYAMARVSPTNNLATSTYIHPKKQAIKPSYFGYKHNLPTLIFRSMCANIAVLFTIYIWNELPLADADTIQKLETVMVIILGWIVFKQPVRIVQIIVVVVSFIGAMLIIKPSFNNPQLLPYLAGLASTVFGAFTYHTGVKLATSDNGENPLTIEANQTVLLAAMSLIPTIYYFQGWEGQGKYYLILFLATIFAIVKQYSLVFALKYAPAFEISAYNYSSLIWMLIFGMMFFDFLPDFWSLAGYVFVVTAGLYLFVVNRRKEQAKMQKRKRIQKLAKARLKARQQHYAQASR